jgi:hypothetical protein
MNNTAIKTAMQEAQEYYKIKLEALAKKHNVKLITGMGTVAFYDADRNDLFTAFNTIQENVIRGGFHYRPEINGRIKRKKARSISSVSENIRLNQALWSLTEKMAELKTA